MEWDSMDPARGPEKSSALPWLVLPALTATERLC